MMEKFVTLGTGSATHIAYIVGEHYTGSLCDRGAWQSKRIRPAVGADHATCSRCLKVEASESAAVRQNGA